MLARGWVRRAKIDELAGLTRQGPTSSLKGVEEKTLFRSPEFFLPSSPRSSAGLFSLFVP